ncbi:PIN/TRAM domain-containing protein [Clostridium sp. SYSU_GA19001]|uniref:PIN/TRAM domain-containing protein n=1 Tax=Clostridium caldaquaticum TaxID=2940653 RepID=UPI0020774E25|nr:PIN/TRAM domain-containing protein [Clostridium caldaquaticum]MCM8711750.1 PIN/TRAM domain-containing protein [Clostridium caldaquaticum]
MLKKIFRSLFTATGLVLGFLIGKILLNPDFFPRLNYFNNSIILKVLFLVFCTLIFGFILFLVSPWINKLIFTAVDYVEKSVQKIPANEIIFGTVGAIVGLVIASLLGVLFAHVSFFWTIIAVIIAIIMALIGADVAVRKREELTSFFSNIKKTGGSKEKKSKNALKGDAKILDTSVIIDGRIFDICQTGFLEGSLIIPNFVLEELRHIADSSDSLKRNRGRRGLDILNKIQKELNIDVQIYEKDFPDIVEVDSKLLKLAQVLNGKVITNDYNLNKVAEFQGVPVLNINELANAVKPVVLPGEEMRIQIIKDGKESGQGIAYLDDGTMIVVEGGRKHIGEIIDVIVTSVLQTAAGRMIFARQKEESEVIN